MMPYRLIRCTSPPQWEIELTLKKYALRALLLIEKSKGLPFETLARAQEIMRLQRDLKLMDRIPDNHMVSLNRNGVFILRRRIPYGRQCRNRQGGSGSTFFSFEEGSNFVQKPLQLLVHIQAGTRY
jgi:hypothetical protein